MARNHARLKLGAMSSDPDLRALAPHSKLVYTFLLQDSYLNAAGVLMLCEQIWAEDLGLSEQEFDKSLTELISTRFVVVDWRTRELLVRSFIRNDGIADQPNVLKQALAHARLARSKTLRRALAVELRRLPAAPPDKVSDKGRVLMVYPDPHACAAELDPNPEPPPKGSETDQQEGSGNPSANSSENPVAEPFFEGMPEVRGKEQGKGKGSISRSESPQSCPTSEAVERAPSLDDGFDGFWEVFPNRVQKQDALKAWRQMRRAKVTAQRMIDGARGYATLVVMENRPKDKIKYPASWLRAGAYDDHQPEPEPVKDTREPIEILRDLWRQADAPAVMRILGLRHSWVDEDPPPGSDIPREKFTVQRRQEWINSHFEDALAVLSAMQVTA